MGEVKIKAFVAKVSCRGSRDFGSREDALAWIEGLKEKGRNGKWDGIDDDKEWSIEEIEYAYVGESLYSDCHAFEIVKVVSPNCIEVRPLSAKLKEGHKPEIIPGGFAGHCVNNRSLKYDFASIPDAKPIRIRRRKRGDWGYKGRKFWLSAEPRYFYDYNF